MSSSAPVTRNDDIRTEQTYLDGLYDRLDQLREQADSRLRAILLEAGGTPQGRSQREATRSHYAEQLAQMNAVENALCFGRLDFAADHPRYVGRIGLFAADREADPLLIDWRAPAARPFYLATAVNPDGVTRRRHLRTRGRHLTGIDDEVLDLAAAGGAGGREDVTGEAALLSALTAGRTGRMRDIVETIQSEQDEVIRAGLPGVLVVQGGPGTGKTAVALHRAAYLLYTYRQQLTRQGVLILGPNPTFLRYISQVLPSLAETGVLLATLGDMFPGVRARAAEAPVVAAVKGRPAMLGVLAAAVADWQTVPDEYVEVDHDGVPLRIERAVCEDARAAARRSGRPHNVARAMFVTEVVHALSLQVAERIGADPLGGDNLLSPADLAETRRELREDDDVQAALFDMWPLLTPRRVLRELLSDPERLASAGTGLAAGERASLLRPHGARWAPADVPLLDELAELLGEDDTLRLRAAESRRQRAVEYAEGVLEIVAGSRSLDFEDQEEEILSATDVVDASAFAERYAEVDTRTTAERAAADRTWVFGHVIVDEAQELSPLAWRLLMRRVPSRSMTVVGDVAQTSELAGTTTWDQVFEPYVAQRWRLAELSVNYRTPAEIMAVAADVLAAIDPALQPPRSVRSAGVAPWARQVPPGTLAVDLIEAVRRETATLSGGRLGVLVPEELAGDLGAALTPALPGAAVGEQPDLLNQVVLMTVRQAKGLEFDTVIVAEPDRIVAESPRGLSDLYVAVTRATRRLGVLHTQALPKELSALG